ncbi:hypothetical protein HZB00_03635 [Candidatus Woesearchaeota archaeon]|nr:hypothetical protein [Candidatus Woesearchaeota archaeon]
MDDLEARIQQRIQQAEDRDIRGKVRIVVHCFGQEQIGNYSGEYYSITRFRKGDLYMHVHSSDSSALNNVPFIEVRYREKLVFMCEGAEEIESYLPGEWEKMVDSLYASAQQINANKLKQIMLEREKQERRRLSAKAKMFGL